MIDAQLVTWLSQVADGRQVALSLSDHGRGLVERLGWQWLAAVIRPIHLTYPKRPIELVLCAATREPMPSGRPISAGLPGGAFTVENGIGILTLFGDPDLMAIERRVSVPDNNLLDEEVPFRFVDADGGLRRKFGDLYTKVYRKRPVLLDRWRQFSNDHKPWTRNIAVRGASRIHPLVEQTRLSGPTTPTAWFALHWLETGGAESWALESMRLAKQAGFQVVITVDHAAPQRVLPEVLELTEEVYFAANVLAGEDWGTFQRALLSHYDVKLLHIHHSTMAYQFLPELRHTAPSVRVVDSTHIIEHRTGGFVRQSIESSELVDLHHVISPQLRDDYVLDRGIAPSKVIYAPLTQVTDGQLEPETPRKQRNPCEPLRIGFLGRLAAQKRPFLFVELVRRLSRKYSGRFSYLMQGSGALESFVDEQVARGGLGNVLERRSWGPVGQFFDDIDVLVISSDNEGLTLTALEADMHGVVVLSADVGSQITVVAPQVLVPRAPGRFLDEAIKVLARLGGEPDFYRDVLDQQHELHMKVRELESASSFFARYFAEILGKA